MKEMTISTEEFIRRFLMHLLPPGFCRVRSAGFLAGCVRKKSLELIYTLLNRMYEPLQKLLDKRDAKRKDDLWNAVMKSEKSYDDYLKINAILY